MKSKYIWAKITYPTFLERSDALEAKGATPALGIGRRRTPKLLGLATFLAEDFNLEKPKLQVSFIVPFQNPITRDVYIKAHQPPRGYPLASGSKRGSPP